MTEPARAVFLSYASQDAEAARRIGETLRAGGIEVWFDQSELRGGDVWDQKIRHQIRDCALFIPIISSNTQERTEGYFRLEWRLADHRTHLMADRPFSYRSSSMPRPTRMRTFRIRFRGAMDSPATGRRNRPSSSASCVSCRPKRLMHRQTSFASRPRSATHWGAPRLPRRVQPRRDNAAVLLLIAAVVAIAVGYFAVDRLCVEATQHDAQTSSATDSGRHAPTSCNS